MMRAGLIIYGDLSITSGGYLYDRQLVRYLQAQGDEIEIIALPWKNYGRHLLDNLRLSLARRLRQAKFDILLQDELNHPSLFLLNRPLRSRIKIPLISIVHHLRSSERHPKWQLQLFRQVERAYLHTIDGFVFNSRTTRATVEALSGQEKPAVVAYPSGSHFTSTVSHASISQRAASAGPLCLLFVGNVSPRKGLHILLDALCLLPQDMWQLEVIGDIKSDTKYSDRLIKSAESSGLSSNITWHGRLSASTLAERITNNHVLIVPSSYEGFGIVYLEGMGYGLPAIGTTSGAAHEIITTGQNGFLIAPDDAVSLARHIANLHKDRQLLVQMGIAALETSKNHPTWETSMRDVREFLLQFT